MNRVRLKELLDAIESKRKYFVSRPHVGPDHLTTAITDLQEAVSMLLAKELNVTITQE